MESSPDIADDSRGQVDADVLLFGGGVKTILAGKVLQNGHALSQFNVSVFVERKLETLNRIILFFITTDKFLTDNCRRLLHLKISSWYFTYN